MKPDVDRLAIWEKRSTRHRVGPTEAESVTFILLNTGCRFVALAPTPVRSPRTRFNRWRYEPLILLIVLSFSLLSPIGDATARLAIVGIGAVVIVGNALRFLRHPRRERSP